ncbi:hypothetical protein ES706_00201 [subsurface metagenome]|nr:hypothetical protein [Hadesarchaea archaeon]
MTKKFGKPKVKIVSPHLWPSLFLTIGFYDPFHDVIVIKGELPKETFRQTLKHEKAHREWHINHSTKTKIYNFLYWKPGLYFILSALAIVFYFFSISSWLRDMVLPSLLLCFLAFFFHYGLIEILERPARKAGSIVGLEGKEMLRLRLLSLIPAFLLLPTVFALSVLGLRSTLVILGLGFLGIWLYQILHIPAILKVEKK